MTDEPPKVPKYWIWFDPPTKYWFLLERRQLSPHVITLRILNRKPFSDPRAAQEAADKLNQYADD